MPMYSICRRCKEKIPFKTKCKNCEPLIRKEKNKEYRIKYDDTEIRRLRHSVKWKKLRQRVIDEQKGLCLLCAVEQQYNPIDDVHHITTAKENINLFFDRDNLIGLCKYHHQFIHANKLDNKESLENYLMNIEREKKNLNKF